MEVTTSGNFRNVTIQRKNLFHPRINFKGSYVLKYFQRVQCCVGVTRKHLTFFFFLDIRELAYQEHISQNRVMFNLFIIISLSTYYEHVSRWRDMVTSKSPSKIVVGWLARSHKINFFWRLSSITRFAQFKIKQNT